MSRWSIPIYFCLCSLLFSIIALSLTHVVHIPNEFVPARLRHIGPYIYFVTVPYYYGFMYIYIYIYIPMDAVLNLSNCTVVIVYSRPVTSSKCHHKSSLHYKMHRIFIFREPINSRCLLASKFRVDTLSDKISDRIDFKLGRNTSQGPQQARENKHMFYFIPFLHVEMTHSLNRCLWVIRTCISMD